MKKYKVVYCYHLWSQKRLVEKTETVINTHCEEGWELFNVQYTYYGASTMITFKRP